MSMDRLKTWLSSLHMLAALAGDHSWLLATLIVQPTATLTPVPGKLTHTQIKNLKK